MKRVFTTLVLLGVLVATVQAQDEGFYTRNMRLVRGEWIQQRGSYIECWRASNQSPNPERIYTVRYNPPPDSIHWWINGEYPIEYGWDYTFIGWWLDPASPTPDTLFSDYTGWQRYDENTIGPWFYTLRLQYSTTRPTMPPRGQ